MSKTPEIDRKELKKPDSFVKTGQSLFQKLAGQRHRLISVISVGLVVVGAVYTYDWWHAKELDKAWKSYYQASQVKEEKRWAALANVSNQMGSNRAGLFAAVDLGDHYFQTAKAEAQKEKKLEYVALSVEWYSTALEFSDLLPVERQLLLVNRGQAHELKSGWQAAIEDFQASDAIGGVASGLAILHLGRIYEQKGESDLAKQSYEKVIVEYSESEYARTAKSYLRALKSSLFSGNLKKGE